MNKHLIKIYTFFLIYFFSGFLSFFILDLFSFQYKEYLHTISYIVTFYITISSLYKNSFNKIFYISLGVLSFLFFKEKSIIYFNIFNIYLIFSFIYTYLFLLNIRKLFFIIIIIFIFAINSLCLFMFLINSKILINSIPFLFIFYLFLCITFIISLNNNNNKRINIEKIIKSKFSFLTIALKKQK